MLSIKDQFFSKIDFIIICPLSDHRTVAQNLNF